MKKEITTLNQQAYLKQSNTLVEAKYRLTTYEQRMIIAICSQLSSESELPKIHVDMNELADFCNFPETKKTSLVKTTSRKLRGRTLEYQLPDGTWYITGWINSAQTFKDGTIEFTIDENLKPQLLELKKAYVNTPAAPLMEFRCDYSPRLYFIFKKMLKIREFEYKLDFFRERLQLSKSYSLFANLKNKVFEPAIVEINEKSDIHVEHKYLKNGGGRGYSHIHFVVTSKNQSKPINSIYPVKRVKLTQNEQEIYDLLTDKPWQITDDMARKIIKKHPLDYILKNIKYAKRTKKGKYSPSGWMVDCIKNDRAGQNEIRKAERQKAKERKLAQAEDKQQAFDFFHGKTETDGDYSPPVIIKKDTNEVIIPNETPKS